MSDIVTLFAFLAAIAIFVMCFVFCWKLINSTNNPVACIPVEARAPATIIQQRVYDSMNDYEKLQVKKNQANQRLTRALLVGFFLIPVYFIFSPVGGILFTAVWVRYVFRTYQDTQAINNATSINQISP